MGFRSSVPLLPAIQTTGLWLLPRRTRVLQPGLPAVGPVHDVVGVAVAGGAAGELALAAIAVQQGAAQGGRDRARPAADVEHLALGAVAQRHEGGIAGQAAGCLPAQVQTTSLLDDRLSPAERASLLLDAHVLDNVSLICVKCGSELVAQDDPKNGDPYEISATCRSCGSSTGAVDLIRQSVSSHFDGIHYETCPECAETSYTEDYGCIFCGLMLGECEFCLEDLTTNSVDPDNYKICVYCGDLMSR